MMLWPNATRVLRDLGVLESLMSRSGPSTHFLVRACHGKVLMDIVTGDFEVRALCARRADLMNALLRNCLWNVVVWGTSFNGWSSREERSASILGQTGRRTRRGDLGKKKS
jgi:2-polyprenyl-6-methoxyphenol hydroxylase-like FAD-dependent oxidoreductase